jgi:hypothetical protein
MGSMLDSDMNVLSPTWTLDKQQDHHERSKEAVMYYMIMYQTHQALVRPKGLPDEMIMKVGKLHAMMHYAFGYAIIPPHFTSIGYMERGNKLAIGQAFQQTSGKRSNAQSELIKLAGFDAYARAITWKEAMLMTSDATEMIKSPDIQRMLPEIRQSVRSSAKAHIAKGVPYNVGDAPLPSFHPAVRNTINNNIRKYSPSLENNKFRALTGVTIQGGPTCQFHSVSLYASNDLYGNGACYSIIMFKWQGNIR